MRTTYWGCPNPAARPQPDERRRAMRTTYWG